MRTGVDRLAHSIRDLQNVVHELDQLGVILRATEQPIDTATAGNVPLPVEIRSAGIAC